MQKMATRGGGGNAACAPGEGYMHTVREVWT